MFKNKKIIIVSVIACLVVGGGLLTLDHYFNLSLQNFSANILQEKNVVFNGTILPIKDNYVYTTMYLGSYDQLGVENVGNHAGVDFAARRGTSIYAIANGVVMISKFGNFGEGYHVVIKHENVPSVDDENVKTTYYSSYLHMEAMPVVSVGQVVKKGDLIGNVGSTGNSTGPHLHLQIDNSNAPFHPYWKADIDKVKLYTIHPLKWITKYKVVDINNTVNNDIDNTIYQDNVGKDVLAKNDEEVSKVYDQKTSSFDFIGSKYAIKGNAINLQVRALDYAGGVDKSYIPKSSINLISASDDVSFLPSILNAGDFKDGIANLVVVSKISGDVNLEMDDGVAYTKTKLYFIDDVKYANKFQLISDKKNIEVGQSLEIKCNVLDNKNELVPNYKMISKKVTLSVEPKDAGYFLPEELFQEDFEFGKANFRFISTKVYDKVKIKAQEGVFVGFYDISISESKNPFIDVDSSNIYFDAIKYLKDKKIVQGYGDGTYKPLNAVSRAEMLKIILLGFKIPVSSPDIASFVDVGLKDWYVSYVYTAKKLGIVNGYPDGNFYPHKTVNKVEALKIVLNAKKIELPKVEKNISADVRYTDWYAPYVKYVVDNDILNIPKDGLFKPDEMMNRGMIADIIYKIEKKKL